MEWLVMRDYDDLSLTAANIMLEAMVENPSLVLGLPTGRTPEGMYARLVSVCTDRYRCFKKVVTFNLDEYVGIPPDHPGSYTSYMKRHLFDHIDLEPENIHIPNGLPSGDGNFDEALQKECRSYEVAIARHGPIDLLYLGLGQNGHIGFNEPGTPFDSSTHVIQLSESTRRANAALFAGGNVPQRAITMGIGTILSAQRVIVMASGVAKKEAVQRLRTGAESVDFPASALGRHPRVTVVCDQAVT